MEWLNLDLFINPFQVALVDGGLVRHVSFYWLAKDASASRRLRRKGGENRPKDPEHLWTHQPFFGPLHDSPAFRIVQHTRPL